MKLRAEWGDPISSVIHPNSRLSSSFPPDLAAQRLDNLLQNPVIFVPATKLSLQLETGSSLIHRPKIPTVLPQDMRVLQYQDALSVAAASGWQIQVACAPIGFQNPNVRCYQNSLLQALLHSSTFVRWLRLHQEERCSVRSCVACALGKLATTYWDGSKTSRQIEALIKKFMSATEKAGSFPWGKDRHDEQQDAHEYYLWLVNTMMEQLPNDAEKLQGMFGIVRSLETECTKCHHKDHRPETELHIVVNCNDGGSLAAKLQSAGVFGEEEIAGVRCDSESCQDRVVEKRRCTTIVGGPDLLCTQIARFQYDRIQGTLAKTNHHISFHENLDLSPFVETHAPLTYRLIAVVYHAGSLDTGHYVSATRTPSGGWERQDDQCVEGCTLEQVLAPGWSFEGEWTPYLMFWEKVQSIPFTSLRRSKSRSMSRSVSRSVSLKRTRGEEERSEAPLGSPPKASKTSHSPSSDSSLGSLFRTPSGSSSRSTRDSSEGGPTRTTPQSSDESPKSHQPDPGLDEAVSGSPSKPNMENELPKARKKWWDFLLPAPAPPPATDPSVKKLEEKVKYLEAEVEKLRRMANPYADLVRTTDLLNRCCYAQRWLIDYYMSLIPKVPSPTRGQSAARKERAGRVEKVAAACFHRATELISMSLRLSELFALTKYPAMSAEKAEFEKDIDEAAYRDQLGEWLEAELEKLETPRLIKYVKK
ncbi:MAG: hypothetical protein Q9167_001401 [Letrouitia subvulpina]